MKIWIKILSCIKLHPYHSVTWRFPVSQVCFLHFPLLFWKVTSSPDIISCLKATPDFCCWPGCVEQLRPSSGGQVLQGGLDTAGVYLLKLSLLDSRIKYIFVNIFGTGWKTKGGWGIRDVSKDKGGKWDDYRNPQEGSQTRAAGGLWEGRGQLKLLLIKIKTF